ncbi:MAG TPA: creatininase family protein [Limnochordia bacterium]
MQPETGKARDGSQGEYRYERLTWPEADAAAREGRVVLLPVGSIEQHGPHLPLDVDQRLAYAVCLEAGRRAPDTVLVMPPVSYGYCHHVMDFPGTINIQMEHFIAFCLDITQSLAYHGFKRIVIVNGHGSNEPLVNLIARKTVVLTDALCVGFSWWEMAREAFAAVRESQFPGGCAHACELETSVYLYLNEAGVRKEAIRDELAAYLSDGQPWYALDLFGSAPTSPIHWTSTYTRSGVIGQPTLASKEKGRVAFEGAVSRLLQFVDWYRRWPDPPRRDRHSLAPTMALPFGGRGAARVAPSPPGAQEVTDEG